MATITKTLGIATAYGYAKSKGYTGTEEEFAQEMANLVAISAEAETLEPDDEATASYSGGVLSFGIPKGDKGDTGETGATGATGATGTGIASITKTGTAGLVDTYTITFTDGTTTTFDVTNGAEAIDATLSIAGRAADAKATGIAVDDLKSDLIPLQALYDADANDTQNKTITAIEWIDGHFYNLTTGEYSTSPVMKASPKYDCNVGDVVVPDANQGQILFFNANGGLSTSYTVTSYPERKAFVAPENTVQFALNNAGSNAQASTFTLYREAKELIVKKVIAPARLLFDSDCFTNKQYVSTANGALYSGDNYSVWYCLPFVKVNPSHKYRTENQTQVIFYSANMTFISALLPSGSSANIGARVEMDFTTPANCAYISVNSQSAHEMLFDIDEYNIAGQDANPQKLTGLSVLSFGDSITGNYAFGDNIPYFVEDFTGAKTYNCGFGGCRMELLSGDSETAQITNPFAMCSIVDELSKPDSDSSKWSTQDAAAATFEQSPRYNRIIKLRLAILKTVDITKIDIVTIAYGTNEIGYTQENQSDAYDKYTYGGATRYSIEKLLELNPKLRIVLLTPIYRHDVNGTGTDSDGYVNSDTGLKMADNINTLKSVGLEYKMPVVDMYHDLGINSENYLSYFGDDDEPDDGTHINSYGRKMYGLRLAGELNRLF